MFTEEQANELKAQWEAAFSTNNDKSTDTLISFFGGLKDDSGNYCAPALDTSDRTVDPYEIKIGDELWHGGCLCMVIGLIENETGVEIAGRVAGLKIVCKGYADEWIK